MYDKLSNPWLRVNAEVLSPCKLSSSTIHVHFIPLKMAVPIPQDTWRGVASVVSPLRDGCLCSWFETRMPDGTGASASLQVTSLLASRSH